MGLVIEAMLKMAFTGIVTFRATSSFPAVPLKEDAVSANDERHHTRRIAILD